jgi:hypothetical protein
VPGQLADDSPLHGTFRPVLEGRFVVHEYEGSLLGQLRQGLWILGYNLAKVQFEATWIDNQHNGTATMFCVGAASPDGFWVLGRYPDPGGGPEWGWRTEFSLLDADHLIMTAYNIMPVGEEAKALETVLARVP